MTTITIDRATVEQALDVLNLVSDEGESKFPATIQGAISDLEAALAQQAEPVAAERERCAEYLMQQAAECRENSPTRVTLESCAAVLRLGLHAQAEPVQEPVAVFDARWGQPVLLSGAPLLEDEQPLYTTPPQRKPLTQEEIAAEWRKASECAGKSEGAVTTSQFVEMFARAVERAHGIREGA